MVDNLNSSMPDERVAASSGLIALGARSVKPVMDRLVLVAPTYFSDKSNGLLVADLTNILFRIITSERDAKKIESAKTDSAQMMRSAASCEFAADLIKLSTSNDRVIRRASTYVLYNVIDDRFVEMALSAIAPALQVNNLDGALNLFDAVKVASTMAKKDIRPKIVEAIAKIEGDLGASLSGNEQIQNSLLDIRGRLAINTVNETSQGVACDSNNLKADGSIKPKIAYLHLGVLFKNSSDASTKVQRLIEGYGIKISGLDFDADTENYAGVDYFDDSDAERSKQIAESINRVSFGNVPRLVPRKKSSILNPAGVFGIWVPSPK
jgi:hypothetical protein